MIPDIPFISGNSPKRRKAMGIRKSGVNAVKGMVRESEDSESALKKRLNATTFIRKLVKVDQMKFP